MSDHEKILQEVKGFLLDEFLAEEDPESLGDETPLISSGVLDSIAVVKLVSHLEESYGVELEAHEMSADYLDTPELIARTVSSRRS
jgi:acyl carrier protein